MAFLPASLLGLIQLSVLLLSCLTVFGGEIVEEIFAQPPHHPPSYPPAEAPKHHKAHPPGHHHHKNHPPSQSPVKPPSHPPVKPPPSHPPVKPPPSHPPVMPPSRPPSYPPPIRTLIAVRGVVFCKPCKYIGVDTLLGASPLSGAVVKLQCNNTKKPLEIQAKTDNKGFFFLTAPKTVTNYAFHKCKVFLVSSPPKSICKKPTNLNYGLKGAMLRPSKPTMPPPHPLPYQLFDVGPFAFEPYGSFCKH